MTQEDKELLLIDLCSRLPYMVKCKDQYGDYINVNIYNAHIEHLIDQIVSGAIQMVLRPMSSMTKEERDELDKLWEEEWGKALNAAIGALPEYPLEVKQLEIMASYKVINWLCVHHFDYRGLIERGLAIEAPNDMYNIK